MSAQDLTKEQLLKACKDVLNRRQEVIHAELAGLLESSASETKSSAGDKYETSREMANLEKQKLQEQQQQVQNEQRALETVPLQRLDTVQHGAMVQTSIGEFFVAASIGKISEGLPFVISASAPISKAMWGLSEGQSFQFNNKMVQISSVS